MLIYKLNAIQSQILTCFFPPWNIILPELPEQIGHALLNLFPKEKRRTEVHFSTFSTCSHVGWFSSVLWWLLSIVGLLLAPLFSLPVHHSLPTPQVPSHAPRAGSAGESPLNLVFIFLLHVIGSCLSSSYADVVDFVLFYLLFSFVLIALEKLAISIYMACIALAILSLQIRKLKTKNSHSSNIK